LFQFLHFPGKVSVLMVAAVSSLTLWAGIRIWLRGQLRIGIAFLLTFCLLLPTVLLLIAIEYKVLDGSTFLVLFFYSFLEVVRLPRARGFLALAGWAGEGGWSAVGIWRGGKFRAKTGLRIALCLLFLIASLFGIVKYHIFFPPPADSELLAGLE